MKSVTITIGNRGIKVSKNLIKVEKGEQDEPISWTIDTPGWKFTKHGIVIHRNITAFHHPGSSNSGTEFHWTSQNTYEHTYKYTVNVTNGTTQATLDPGIKNGGK